MGLIFSLGNTFAQEVPKVTNEEKNEVIKNLCLLVKNEYVFAEKGILVSKKIEENLKAGKYKSIENIIQMCDVLTDDLQTISKDDHFTVGHSPEQVQRLRTKFSKTDSLEIEKIQIQEGKKYNFGFNELKILEGNIGYLNLSGFYPLKLSKETIISAMNFLSNTEAIILDLRNNRGGSIDMPPYLASYFLGNEKQTLLQFINRDNKQEDKAETTQPLEGKRLFGKQLYILTSNKTFSAAEAFTYTLKNRKVAITVGEKTGGGANPIVAKVLNENFVLGLPTYSPIDPLTGTNWERTGILPDIEVTTDKAKETAHIKAIENIANQSNSADAKWLLGFLKGKYNPITLNAQTLKFYVGKYGIRTLMFENNTLYYQKQGQSKIRLTPISETTFMLENNNELRIEMIIENNVVKGFNKIYSDGTIEFERRD